MQCKEALCLVLMLLTAACASPAPTPTQPAPTSPASLAVFTPTPQAATRTPAQPSAEPSLTPSPAPTATAMPSPSRTPAPSPSPPSTPLLSEALVVDHTSLALFDQLPDSAIAQAAQTRLLVRHASIGENISRGLDCLWGNYPGRRPSHCTDRYDLKYDRSRWVFQFRGNPGWIDKVEDFIAETESQLDDFDVFAVMLNYGDGLDGLTYPLFSDPENFQTLYADKLEALEAAHPGKTFVWWTMALARVGTENGQRFNEMVRAYARANGKILFDIADIQSHAPDGTPSVYDVQLTCRGQVMAEPNGAEVLFDGYTDEDCGGHLNEIGRERLAIAMWVLMARLTGWSPETGAR